MKNSSLSFEAILLLVLLLAGIYGVSTFLKGDEVSSDIASPRQEAPAMVMAPETVSDTY